MTQLEQITLKPIARVEGEINLPGSQPSHTAQPK